LNKIININKIINTGLLCELHKGKEVNVYFKIKVRCHFFFIVLDVNYNTNIII